MGSAKRLLVVDDDVDFADSLADLMRAENFDVTVAYDGSAAVQVASREAFDLTLIDVQMPGKNGVDSLVEIRRNSPEARVVMMTGYSVPELLDRALAEGAAGVMYKPLNFDRIREIINHSSLPPVVLVADDDEDHVESLRAILEAEGYSVMAAGNGHEAIERARTRRPDVLLLDLRMPGVNGIETYLELGRSGALPPTIVVSAYLEQERENLQALSGLDPRFLLDKPVDSKHLISLLQRVVTA